MHKVIDMPALAIKTVEDAVEDDGCMFYTFKLDDTVKRASERDYSPTLGDVSKTIDFLGLYSGAPKDGTSISFREVGKLLKKMRVEDRLIVLGKTPDPEKTEEMRKVVFSAYKVNTSKLYNIPEKPKFLFLF
jgi:hypothetical protein